MDRPLDGKIVLITGSGSGMGRSHALLMAGRGARAIVHDIDPDRVAETALLVRDTGAPPHGICVDMRDTAALQAAIAEAERDYGPIDVLVNNAGIGGQGLALADIDAATFDAMFETHVRGTFFATQAVAPGLLETNLTIGSIGRERIAAMAAEVPLGRIAEPVEISYTVAWLASAETDFMTGQVISPNGGVSIVGI